MDALYERYADAKMKAIFSNERRYRLWRELWTVLAEEQRSVGLEVVSEEAIKAMRKASSKVDFDRAEEFEKKFRHDVMAHIYAFAEDAPEAAGIIHLGATSYFVVDNTDLILTRDATDALLSKLVFFIKELRNFAVRYKGFTTASYTHFQVAQPTTMGRRACTWLFDFCTDAGNLANFRHNLRFRSIKGAVGTQASFMLLLDGDSKKVAELERRIARRFGFDKTYTVCNQIYPRKVDVALLDTLSSFAVSAHKFATDVRLLCSVADMEVVQSSQQVGSSAMPHKRNPIWAERICALARYLFSLCDYARQTAAHNWLERSLDDSAARRIYIPRAFLTADAVLKLCYGTLKNIRPLESRNLKESIPLLVAEPLLMLATLKGADRQKTHSVLKEASQIFRETGSVEKMKSFLMKKEPFFKEIDIDEWLDAERLTGRAEEQVENFIKEEVDPLIERFGAVEVEQPEV